MNHNKITAYHPQANGQVERTNREIKKYLRKYVNENQDNWPELFPMLEYALNTRKPDRRTYIPYQIVYGETPAMTAKKEQEKIQFKERAQKEARNPAKGHPVPEYKENDWVYLQRRKRRKNRPSISLDHRWWRLFRIKRRTGPQNVELDLLEQIKIHPVVNVSSIKPHYGNPSATPTIPQIDERFTEYKVEFIDDERKGGKEYRVKWKGYREKTWEPIQHLTNAQDAIRLWKKRANATAVSGND